MANKIKYGLKNCYYAVATIAADHSATYAEPVALPGAVSLELSPEGSMDPFYADDIQYYVSNANNGYSGNLELALIPEAFYTDVLGAVEDTAKVIYEDKDAQAVHFALLFQFEGDEKATRHVLYNCVASRPNVNGSTKEDSITPETETIALIAASIYNATLAKEIVKAKTGNETTEATYKGWFSAVYQAAAGN